LVIQVSIYTVSKKTKKTYFCHNLCRISITCDNFWHKMANSLQKAIANAVSARQQYVYEGP